MQGMDADCYSTEQSHNRTTRRNKKKSRETAEGKWSTLSYDLSTNGHRTLLCLCDDSKIV